MRGKGCFLLSLSWGEGWREGLFLFSLSKGEGWG